MFDTLLRPFCADIGPNLAVRAARQAAASAALDLAYSYLSEASKFWSYSASDAWSNHPGLAMDLLTITIEVALGRRTATSVIENVSRPVMLDLANADSSWTGPVGARQCT